MRIVSYNDHSIQLLLCLYALWTFEFSRSGPSSAEITDNYLHIEKSIMRHCFQERN